MAGGDRRNPRSRDARKSHLSVAAAGDTVHGPEQRACGRGAPRSRRQGLHGRYGVRRGGPSGGDVAGLSSAAPPATSSSGNSEEWRRRGGRSSSRRRRRRRRGERRQRGMVKGGRNAVQNRCLPRFTAVTLLLSNQRYICGGGDRGCTAVAGRARR